MTNLRIPDVLGYLLRKIAYFHFIFKLPIAPSLFLHTKSELVTLYFFYYYAHGTFVPSLVDVFSLPNIAYTCFIKQLASTVFVSTRKGELVKLNC